MNKKDINILKKVLSNDNNAFTVNNVLCAAINSQTVLYKSVKSWINYKEDEQNLIIDIIKKTLSGKIGKVLNEYNFIQDDKGNSESQNILHEVLLDRFDDDTVTDTFIEHIKENVTIQGTYTVFAVNYTVSIYNKEDKSVNELTFISTAFCPIKLRVDGLIFNDVENVVEKKATSDRILDKAAYGFLYPICSDFAQDVNHVMYYNQKPNDINLTILENFLGCKFKVSAERQKNVFWGILSQILGNDLNSDLIIKINEKLSDIIDIAENTNEARELDCSDCQKILGKCGLDNTQLERFGKLYEEQLSSRHTALLANNIGDHKVTVKAAGLSINIAAKNSGDNLMIRDYNGKKCIIIPYDSNTLSILGIDTKD